MLLCKSMLYSHVHVCDSFGVTSRMQVVRALNTSCFMILNELLTLFRDDSLDVFYGIVTYLPDTLETYMKCYHNATTHLDTKVSVLSL